MFKTLDRECLFNRTTEAAFKGRNMSKKIVQVILHLRKYFKLKNLLLYIGFSKTIYMDWQTGLDRENSDAEPEGIIMEIRKDNKDFYC